MRLAVIVIAALAAVPAAAGDLVVTVTGVDSPEGEVGCALHQDAAAFPQGPAARTQWRKAAERGVRCRFQGLEPGSYAVSVFHDANGNRKLDTNLLGIPAEAWGMSNNVRPALRAPDFAEAKLDVGAGARTIEVRLRR